MKHYIKQEKPISSEQLFFYVCQCKMIWRNALWLQRLTFFFQFRIMWNDAQNSKTIYNVSNDGTFLVHVNFNLLKWRTNFPNLIWWTVDVFVLYWSVFIPLCRKTSHYHSGATVHWMSYGYLPQCWINDQW